MVEGKGKIMMGTIESSRNSWCISNFNARASFCDSTKMQIFELVGLGWVYISIMLSGDVDAPLREGLH